LNYFPGFSVDILRVFVDTITANTEIKPTVKGESLMRSNNRIVVPEAKDAMNKFKMEAANEVGVDLKQGYNGHLTSREAGSVGGQMVKKMIESYESKLKSE
jgi:small acid-soluble spore protein D (minor alpha/beta-type SASP)